MAAMYGVFKWRWGQESWFKDKVADTLSLILIYAVLLVSSMLIPLITRPVMVEVKQPNKHYPDASETRFSILGSKRSLEHERTVALKLRVKRSYSFWGIFIVWVVKRFHFQIVVEPLTDGIVLQAFEIQQRTDLTETQTGFSIHLGDYLGRILMRSSRGESEKECVFKIIEDTLHPVTKETIQISPFLTRDNGQAVPHIIAFLIGFKYENHVVHFKRE